MTSETKSHLIHYADILNSLSRHSHFVRGIEFQKEAIGELKRAHDNVRQLKKKCVDHCEEEDANALLALEKMIVALSEELGFYVALKDDKLDLAWDHLINAQIAVQNALRSHPIGQVLETTVDRLLMLERVLFPPQIFASLGFIAYEACCSICNKDYDECDHIKGTAYMGEICSRVITRAEPLEVSLVSDPANKRCRQLAVPDDDGHLRHPFSWRLIPEE